MAVKEKYAGPADGKTRCNWCLSDPAYVQYHDEEWGRAVHDDRTLFAFLVLESFQAGLSWLTILKKRENFRKAFAGFDPEQVAQFTDKDVARLVADAGIVRHRLKIEAAINNAQRFLEVQQEFGAFDRYIWQFTGGKTIINYPETIRDLPTRTPVSEAMSKDLKKRGFTFMGTTVCYAFMQAVGMVDDHINTCYRKSE